MANFVSYLGKKVCGGHDAPASEGFDIGVTDEAKQCNLFYGVWQGDAAKKFGYVLTTCGKFLAVTLFTLCPSMCVHGWLNVNQMLAFWAEGDDV